ncbi:hypothetical protein IQ265_16355 [Nodosilinea sp. LEGE 06152]|uniref:hypothetical protein n=1 Tax=Nodosilinea sp. LEGE 06152 TaxID=2777966 RepID=UPI00187E7797|nr:hypothetical protein [Nodosilinea sp. LEGE 06152]MBE9158390.1 hypothetical protein [Nodosilinea sp. LEGE 06152]
MTKHKHSHPELDGQNPQTLYTFQLKRPGQTLRERITWGALGLSVGLGIAASAFLLTPQARSWSWPNRAAAAAQTDPFRQGAGQAMAAAELTQTAEFSEDWAEVAMLWQQAIAHMRAVPKANPNAALAQEKVAEYERNLKYAQSNVGSRASRTPTDKTYWTLGSDSDLVRAIQGAPSQTMQYQTACQQTLRYGNSFVELHNGYVKQYDNADGNLRVLANESAVVSARAAQGSWTLGSTQAEVAQIQGAPTRQEQYTSERFTTFYYGKSSVLFENGQAIGYLNSDNNLKVSLQLPAPPPDQAAPPFWTMGSSRTEVLRAEAQTPIAISRNDTNCEEVFHFSDGEVTFRQGLVTGYRDRGGSLKVR